MKQSKRLLCVLLAMVMILSTMTVAASAYKTSYQNPAGRDKILDPYFTQEQAATALLDYIDDNVFAPMNVRESVAGIDIVIYSFDSLFDTIDGVMSDPLYGFADFFVSLGDIEKMDVSIPRNHANRRSSKTMSDFQFLQQVLRFAQANHTYIAKLIGNEFNLGIIGNFVDLGEMLPMLNDLHAYVCEMLYKLLIDPDGVGFDAATCSLDGMLQDFLNNRAIKFIGDMLANPDGSNPLADFLGLPKNDDGTLKNQMGLLQLLPSLTAADININKSSTYDFFSNIFGALIDDIVIPFAGGIILDALKIVPDDVEADTSYINIAIDLFVTYESVGLTEEDGLEAKVAAFLEKKGVENPTKPKPIDKINAALEYILGEGITQYVYFEDDGRGGKYLTLSPTLVSDLANYIKILLPLLNTLIPEAPALTPEQQDALSEMGDEATFAFAVQLLLETFVPGVRFPHNCATIKELATYTLINVAAELAPSIDFEAQIESGALVPDSLHCLDVAAVVIRYYVVGETAIEVPNEQPSFEEVLNNCFDDFLGKYATLFTVYPTQADKDRYSGNIWYKLYNSINQWIPLSNIIYGCEDSYLGLKEVFMDKIIGNALNFDVNGLLSIIGERPDSELQKPLTQLIANLLARVINGVFKLKTEKASNLNSNAEQKDLIIPYAYKTLDEILYTTISSSGATNGCGLRNTVDRLLYYITNITAEGAFLHDSIDVLATLIGVIDLNTFEYMKSDFSANHDPSVTYSINDLKTLYAGLNPSDNEGVKYYEDAYEYFHMVDFAPWTYIRFRSALSTAKELITQYEESIQYPDAVDAPARADITYAYYALEHTYSDLLTANQTIANNYQLNKVYNKTVAAGYTNVNPDGSQKYTSRSWYDYQNAISFASKVMKEYAEHKAQGILGDYKQSKVNMARKMLIEAVDNLKFDIGDADYDELIRAINRINNLSSPYLFSNETVNKVISAYKDAVAFNSEVKYDKDHQTLVDSFTNALSYAYDSLDPLPSIDLLDPEAQHLELQKSYIYGFQPNFFTEEEQPEYFDFNDYFTWNYGYPMGGDYLGIKSTENGNGTGAKIQVLTDRDGDGEYETSIRDFTMIIFGDVNGDSRVDAMDAVVMKAYASFMLSLNSGNQYITYAADLNFDGSVGITDAKKVENVGVGKDVINQSPSQYTENNTTFLDLVKAS